MRSVILGLVLGVWFLQTHARLPDGWTMMALGCAALLCFLFFQYWRRHERRSSTVATLTGIALMCSGGVLVGYVWAAAFAHYQLREGLSAQWEGQDLMVTGTVVNLPYRFDGGERFQFAVERAQTPEGAVLNNVVPKQLLLSWYAGFRHEENRSLPRIEPGERWRLTVRLQRRHGNANPYGFDYEVWLLEQGVRATGYVRAGRDEGADTVRLDTFVWSPMASIEHVRSGLRDRIEEALAGKPYAGVIVALVLGEQRGISQSDWQVFNRTRISHLVSISGLHITMVAGLFAGLMSFFGRHFFLRGRSFRWC